jgi:hypothetical protein
VKLEQLMEKKKKEGADIDPLYKKAKMSSLESLRDEMNGMMKQDLLAAKHPKKVEVMASDEQGLKAGLEKAEDIIAGSEESEGLGEEQSPVDEAASLAMNMSPEEIEELMKKLEMMKSQPVME